MNRIRLILTTAAMLWVASGEAQPSQLEANSEFMFKLELGYSPFVGNTGTADEEGYALQHQESAAGIDAVAGVNLYQDWFVGGGVGGQLFHNLTQHGVETKMGATVFADADYRPWRQSPSLLEKSTVAIMFAPLVGVRAGASALMGEEMKLSPMAEVYGGISWYYARGLRNTTPHRHSVYATLGVAYMQQTVFLPVRIGWRW